MNQKKADELLRWMVGCEILVRMTDAELPNRPARERMTQKEAIELREYVERLQENPDVELWKRALAQLEDEREEHAADLGALQARVAELEHLTPAEPELCDCEACMAPGGWRVGSPVQTLPIRFCPFTGKRAFLLTFGSFLW